MPRAATNAQLTRDLAEFSPWLKRTLGAPLYDPPVSEPQVQPTIAKDETPPPRKKKRNRKPDLRIIGTMIEAGRSLAILVDAEGSIQLYGEGDSIQTRAGNGRVDKIDVEQVTLSFQDETLTLETPH